MWVLGAFEAILLVGFVVVLEAMGTRWRLGVSTDFGFIVGIKLGIGNHAPPGPPAQFSSAILGYPLAVANSSLRRFRSRVDWMIAALAATACLGYVGELLRWYGFWQGRLLLSWPLLVMLLDWVQIVRFGRADKHGVQYPLGPP
jgi:hypothetical protein